MKHVYLNKKAIYFASANGHITRQEANELVKMLERSALKKKFIAMLMSN